MELEPVEDVGECGICLAIMEVTRAPCSVGEKTVACMDMAPDCCTEYSLGKLYLTLPLPPSSPERRGQGWSLESLKHERARERSAVFLCPVPCMCKI